MGKSIIILTAISLCAISAFAAASTTIKRSEFGSARSRSLAEPSGTISLLSPQDISDRIAEAKRLLQSTPTLSGDSVRLAVLDPDTAQLNVLALSKDEFLTKDAELSSTTQLDRSV